MDVLVFATNILLPQQVNRVSPLLTAVPAITNWNFDLEDCDHILRVEAINLCARDIESLLETAGFNCVELE